MKLGFTLITLGLLVASACAANAQVATEPTPDPAPAESSSEADGRRVLVELNKLETIQQSCRSYFIVRNGLSVAIKELQIEVFAFDQSQAINGQYSLVFPDIRANRNKVVIFDIDALRCDDIQSFLVNEVIGCTGEDGAQIEACPPSISTLSKASARLEY